MLCLWPVTASADGPGNGCTAEAEHKSLSSLQRTALSHTCCCMCLCTHGHVEAGQLLVSGLCLSLPVCEPVKAS